jgi:hypothetical protein
VMVFIDRVSRTICLGWLQTKILLIFAFWVARITGVSHRSLANKISSKINSWSLNIHPVSLKLWQCYWNETKSQELSNILLA